MATQQETKKQWEATRHLVTSVNSNANEGTDADSSPKAPTLGKSKAQCKEEWEKAHEICEDLIKKVVIVVLLMVII